MTPSLYVFVGGLVTAAVGGWRYWLTRGRSAPGSVNEEKPAGTAVPEGTAKADGKEKQ